jgi:Ca2+-binding EF-hand superfamily protein
MIDKGPQVPALDDYEATFDLIDADKDGMITAVELKALMIALGESMDDAAAGTMIGFIDTDGDGKVDRQELAAYLSAR